MPNRITHCSIVVAVLAFALNGQGRAAIEPLQGEDPPTVVGFSSFVGGSGRDSVAAVAIDREGNVILAGETSSADFPVLDAGQTSRRGPTDAFVMKVSADGSRVVNSTYIGGSADDRASGVSVDPSGNVYVTGVTNSLDFPVTPDAYDLENGRFPTCAGGDCIDSFVVKIPAEGGPFSYATYLGGEHDDYAAGIAVDAEGNAFVTGSTNSFGIPRDNAFEPDKKQGSEGFITKLNPDGSGVLFSSYIGGNRGDGGSAIAVTPDGGAVFAGTSFSLDFLTKNPVQAANAGGPSPETSLDGFVARVTATGELSWSTYFGGFGRDAIRAVTLSPDGSIVLAGSTSSSALPLVNPAQSIPGGGGDAFVARLTADGGEITYSTYFGGSRNDELLGLAAGSDGAVTAVGLTRSQDLNVVSPIQSICGGCVEPGFQSDAMILRLRSDGTLAFMSYLGGAGGENANAAAVGQDGVVAFGGQTFSSGFPVTPGSFGAICPCPAGSTDNGFVTTLGTDEVVIVPPVISQIVSAKRPYRLIITGSNIAADAVVYLGADSTPWPDVVVGGPTSISVGRGKQLKSRFPKGVQVPVRVVNPDGGQATLTFTR